MFKYVFHSLKVYPVSYVYLLYVLYVFIWV